MALSLRRAQALGPRRPARREEATTPGLPLGNSGASLCEGG